MAKKGAVDKWLCQVYNSRNAGFDADVWDDFDEFCEENDISDEFVQGKKRNSVKREKYHDDEE